MRNIFTIVAAALIAMSTSAVAETSMTKEDKKKLNTERRAALGKALSLHETQFSVPNEFSDVAWDRATHWITQVSDLTLYVATDTVLETHPSTLANAGALKCQVNREREVEDSTFTCLCETKQVLDSQLEKRGTVMLARYIMTGDPNCLDSGYSKADAAECFVECSTDPVQCEPRLPELIFSVERPAADESSCSLEQITAMARAGLSDQQIKSACGDGS